MTKTHQAATEGIRRVREIQSNSRFTSLQKYAKKRLNNPNNDSPTTLVSKNGIVD
jgi:hypothetical protein